MHLVEAEDGNGPSVAYVGGALQGVAPHLAHLAVQTRPVVEKIPSEVQLSQVPRVVHVSQKYVNILRCTETCKQRTKADSFLSWEFLNEGQSLRR